MICPKCLKSIEDNETFCPHCNTYVGTSAAGPANELVYCDGCGARLTSSDRICPKCGRPAPAILSAQSASTDLAAGRTASFPRLTGEQIENNASSVAQVLDDGYNPAVTSVLRASDIEKHSRKVSSKSVEEDPYHKKRRNFKPLIITLIVLMLVGGGAYFVVYDPMGVMPGWKAAFEAAAKEAFPSRQVAEDSDSSSSETETTASETTGADASDASEEVVKQTVLTDNELFEKLSTIYQDLVDYGDEDHIGQCIDSFNASYMAKDHTVREQDSAGAYQLRDDVQATIDEIDSLNVASDTVYAEDIEHMRSLAQWMYGRIDQICQSWDVSLSYTGDDKPYLHSDEILAPMREAGSEDLNSYKTYIGQWKPQQK